MRLIGKHRIRRWGETRNRHRLLIASCIIGLCLSVAGPSAIGQVTQVPTNAMYGFFANVWVERYEGSLTPTFNAASHLEPGTNYLVVVDIAALNYRFARDMPFVVSVDLGQLAGELRGQTEYDVPIVAQLVIGGDRDFPDAAQSFSIHGYRAKGLGMMGSDILHALDSIDPTSWSIVDSDVMTLLRLSNGYPRWMLDRQTFLLSVKPDVGPSGAPVAIAFRRYDRLGKILDVVSTRFCVATDLLFCAPDLPRESEEMEGRIAGKPLMFPQSEEIDLDPRYLTVRNGNGGDATQTWVWNSWVSRRGDGNRRPVDFLQINTAGAQSTYVLQIDASLYQYSRELGLPSVEHATPDRLLLDLVRKRLDEGDTELHLVVRAEAIGDSIEIVDKRAQEIKVDLTRLNPESPPRLAEIGPRITIKELSALTSATTIEVQVRAVAAGCGAVALSISDESGIRPLDHLVHLLEVAESSERLEGCAPTGTSTNLLAGVRNLIGHKGAPKVDAAIHIFELFPYEHDTAAAFLYGIGSEYYSWELARPLSEYLADKANLEARIREARTQTAEYGIEHAYDRAAQELAGAIFSGASPAEQKKADAALHALQSYVKASKETKTFLAKLTDRHGEVLFIPLGILSAPGEHAVLDNPINVVLPLEREEYGQPGCIDNWAVAVSDDLEGSEISVPSDVKKSGNWLGDSFESLRGYLTERRPANREGLVIVAHHDAGRLRYRQNDFPLQVHEIKKPYGPATVAVLAMCEAGGITPVDRRLIQRLNEFGLDAAILSPFSLDANYGKAFAIEFSRIVNVATQSKHDDTLQDLFTKAVAATAATMKDHPKPEVRGSVGDMGLEMIVVGNPTIRLCKD